MSSVALDINKPALKSEPRPLRFVTAASLFDGHDAAINVMRRILQSSGVEVIHLAHNRSVAEVAETAIQEDVDGIAVSSYQGGHIEYFKYMVDILRQRGGDHIKVFGGGGGVIIPSEIEELHEYGVTRIYSPKDGQQLGLQGMIDDMISHCSIEPDSNFLPDSFAPDSFDIINADRSLLARTITALENGYFNEKLLSGLKKQESTISKNTPVLGITGTGGAGKSSLTDEIIRRFRLDSRDDIKLAVLAVDPTRRKTGGA